MEDFQCFGRAAKVEAGESGFWRAIEVAVSHLSSSSSPEKRMTTDNEGKTLLPKEFHSLTHLHSLQLDILRTETEACFRALLPTETHEREHFLPILWTWSLPSSPYTDGRMSNFCDLFGVEFASIQPFREYIVGFETQEEFLSQFHGPTVVGNDGIILPQASSLTENDSSTGTGRVDVGGDGDRSTSTTAPSTITGGSGQSDAAQA